MVGLCTGCLATGGVDTVCRNIHLLVLSLLLQFIDDGVHQPHWYANATVFIVVASFCAITFAYFLFLKVKAVRCVDEEATLLESCCCCCPENTSPCYQRLTALAQSAQHGRPRFAPCGFIPASAY